MDAAENEMRNHNFAEKWPQLGVIRGTVYNQETGLTGMIDALFPYVAATFAAFYAQFWRVLAYPVTSGQRVFWLYLLSSMVFAYWVYVRRSKASGNSPRSLRSFATFLFPKEVWSHSSAWLDVRYFFFHQVLGKLLYVIVIAIILNGTFQWVTGGPNLVKATQTVPSPTWVSFVVSFGYMIVVIAIVDFVAYILHYLQHKVPILWEFHKVHHSAEVMHPLSNYREHPIDNIAYAVGTGAAFGAMMGLANNYFGYLPSMPEILGVPLILFLFNIAGYNLRHSHVWLRWPGRLSMIFPSPAHHHVHHSRHPDHLDKNFAFVFPMWDVLFRTYHMPESDKDVEFGLYGQQGESEYSSCWRLYYIPFRNIAAKQRAAPKSKDDNAPSNPKA